MNWYDMFTAPAAVNCTDAVNVDIDTLDVKANDVALTAANKPKAITATSNLRIYILLVKIFTGITPIKSLP